MKYCTSEKFVQRSLQHELTTRKQKGILISYSKLWRDVIKKKLLGDIEYPFLNYGLFVCLIGDVIKVNKPHVLLTSSVTVLIRSDLHIPHSCNMMCILSFPECGLNAHRIRFGVKLIMHLEFTLTLFLIEVVSTHRIWLGLWPRDFCIALREES